VTGAEVIFVGVERNEVLRSGSRKSTNIPLGIIA
jgi:hypothetical protein